MLHAFFGPAMAIMSRLRFGLKLGLIGILFLAPIAALVYFLNGKLNDGYYFRRRPSGSASGRSFPARGLLEAIAGPSQRSSLPWRETPRPRKCRRGIATSIDAAVKDVHHIDTSRAAIEIRVIRLATFDIIWAEIQAKASIP